MYRIAVTFKQGIRRNTDTMSLTKMEIIDYASLYVSVDRIIDFPMDGDLFCFLHRKILQNKVYKDDEGWLFSGYGICTGYQLDLEEKPAGKWIWFLYKALHTYPPVDSVSKLQPPHIVRGIFHSVDRAFEIKIIKISLVKAPPISLREKEKKSGTKKTTGAGSKLVAFPQKKRKKESL
jgi:hypothetical protein